jgi:hypothetical protein
VEILLTNREFPVEDTTREIFLTPDVWRKRASGGCARAFVGRFACLRRRDA